MLKIGDFKFRSRLFIGTGKYENFEIMKKAHEASGAEVVTVAIRRVNFDDDKENLLNYIDKKKFTILPNTAGCYSAEESIRTARLARELGMPGWIKLEVIGDQKTLMPDNEETLKATKVLVKEGFTVLAYANDDIVYAKKLEEAGASSVMPLGSPIGSGQGILNPNNIRHIIENAKVPIIVDAGVGTASDVSVAMELGADGVLLNTGVALAKDPARMARAMKLAIEAGRDAFLAGRIPKKLYASASSPVEGIIK
ncbi:thiazole synthase [Candidatus Woesearchaeota archaeon]|nr:thiazole synthase [Candidatus Woesearchaeota archaeon]